jgi:hypothetical protein
MRYAAMSYRPRTPRWALVSAVAAPVALIGGWTVAADRQPSFNAVRQTISALAAHGAQDRWLMTGGLAILGVSHLVTASGLRPARLRGRIALAVGGGATIAVAAFPQPQGGSSSAHTASATVAFVALSGWPLLAGRPGARSLLAPGPSAAGSVALTGLLVWFGIALGGDHVGVAERALAGAQALWPLAVVASTLSSRRSALPRG